MESPLPPSSMSTQDNEAVEPTTPDGAADAALFAPSSAAAQAGKKAAKRTAIVATAERAPGTILLRCVEPKRPTSALWFG
jgi:hypothetical protein